MKRISAAGEIEIDIASVGKGKLPLTITPCIIDKTSVGERWIANDEGTLAAMVGIVAMGQASHAAEILAELVQPTPAFTQADLVAEAKITLTVQEKKQEPRIGYPRWQRDGFIFEVISWIAARQSHGEHAFLKDPHVSSTSQGVDGLMLELSIDRSKIERSTVFEDKCSDNPNHIFDYKVIPAFKDRHENRRNAEIISTASVLLRTAGIGNSNAARMSAAVTERSIRRYRAALAVTDTHDTDKERRELFAKYVELEGLTKDQRLGACFVVPPKLRDWFDKLALMAVNYLDGLTEDDDV
ncbi:hypothetical protein PXJ20_30120 [Paraburkholderia sp. A1RI_3L]|uniref:hypothetical protein n=1 Tax=Paraburkholderia TaxID=1822464 RepID=UPI003B7C49D3